MPESLEAMFASKGMKHAAFLGGVRCMTIDNVHYFAGDDRGWHLPPASTWPVLSTPARPTT